MKKMLLVLAILAIATPAWAEVVITAVDSGGGLVTISYDASGESSLVRAFALDITVSGSATITAAGELDPNYWVHPGSMTFWGGDVNSVGTAVCDANTYAGTLPGLDTNGVTLEMATLYVGAPNAPGDSGPLCTVTVDDDCDLSIVASSLRGGVVLEDGTVADVNVTGATDVPITVADCGCMPCAHPDWTEWDTVGRPASWCNLRQCRGDLDNAQEKIGKTWYWVGFVDFGIFLDNWQDKAGIPAAYQADLNHASEKIGKTWYRVGFVDFGIFLDNWQDKLGSPADCLDVP